MDNNNNKNIILIIVILIILYLLQKSCGPLIDYKEVKTNIKIDTIIKEKIDTIKLKDTILKGVVKKLEQQKLVLLNENLLIKKILNKKDTLTGQYKSSDIAFLHENFINDTLYDAKINTLILPKNCQILNQNLELKLKNRKEIIKTKEAEIVKTITNTIIKNNKGKIGVGLNINSLNILELQGGYNINNNVIIKGGYINNLSTNEKGISIGTYITF